MAKGDLPVLVGVGQSLSQWDGTSGADGAPSPLSLMVDASRAALSDSGADLSKAIDTIAVVRIFEDSVGGAPSAPLVPSHWLKLCPTPTRTGRSPFAMTRSLIVV